VHKLAELVFTLCGEGYAVYFWGTQRRDEDVIADVVAVLQNDFGHRQWPADRILRSRTVEELMCNISICDVTVATRFHGTVLSLLAEKPLIAICYYRKARELMEEMGQGQYAVPFETFAVDDLLARFSSLEKNMYEETEKIRNKNKEYRDLLERQYNTLFIPSLS
jgi:polysaccharide pyruvyl transferase WcaK-like protein